jgi:hypothetical protein
MFRKLEDEVSVQGNYEIMKISNPDNHILIAFKIE